MSSGAANSGHLRSPTECGKPARFQDEDSTDQAERHRLVLEPGRCPPVESLPLIPWSLDRPAHFAPGHRSFANTPLSTDRRKCRSACSDVQAQPGCSADLQTNCKRTAMVDF